MKFFTHKLNKLLLLFALLAGFSQGAIAASYYYKIHLKVVGGGSAWAYANWSGTYSSHDWVTEKTIVITNTSSQLDFNGSSGNYIGVSIKNATNGNVFKSITINDNNAKIYTDNSNGSDGANLYYDISNIGSTATTEADAPTYDVTITFVEPIKFWVKIAGETGNEGGTITGYGYPNGTSAVGGTSPLFNINTADENATSASYSNFAVGIQFDDKDNYIDHFEDAQGNKYNATSAGNGYYYLPTVTATSKDQENPTVYNFKVFFGKQARYYVHLRSTIADDCKDKGTISYSKNKIFTSEDIDTTFSGIGKGSWRCNKTVYLYAKPIDGYCVDKISDSNGKTYNITITNDGYNRVQICGYSNTITSTDTEEANPTRTFTVHFTKLADHYVRVIVKSSQTEAGKVDVSAVSTDEHTYEISKVLNDTVSAAPGAKATKTYYFYGQPNEGYYFDTWKDADGKSLSSNSSMNRTLEATSTDPTKPTEYTYIANFEKYKTYYFKVDAKPEDVSKGKVKVTVNDNDTEAGAKETFTLNFGASKSKDNAQKRIYLFAAANDGYILDYWTNDADGSKITPRIANSNYAYIDITSAAADESAPAEFSFTAHFRRLNVYVDEESKKYGDVTIDNIDNVDGNTVTIKAKPYKDGLVGARFLGWKDPKGNMITESNDTYTLGMETKDVTETFAGRSAKSPVVEYIDTTYTLKMTVGDNTIGKYTPVFTGKDMTKGGYYSMHNFGYSFGDGIGFSYYNEWDGKFDGSPHVRAMGLRGTSQVRIGESDSGNKGISRYPIYALYGVNNEWMHSSPAFVVKMSGTPQGQKGGLSHVDLSAQGVSIMPLAEQYGGVVGISYSKRFQQYGYNYYTIDGRVGGLTGHVVNWGDATSRATTDIIGKDNIAPGLYNGSEESLSEGAYWWNITEYTEGDDSIAYFGAMPSESSKIGNRYYTTMYTAFPYKLLDGVQAYIVDKVNADGTVHLKEIEEKVPAYTPVILKCKTIHPKTNRLLPLDEDVPAITDKNYLKGEMSYLQDPVDNQDAYRTKFDAKKMRVLSYDGSKFKNVNNVNYYVSFTKDVPFNGYPYCTDTLKHGEMPYIENNTCYLDISEIENPAATYSICQNITLEGDTKVDNWATLKSNDGMPANVTFKRNLTGNNGWYAVCLPFDVDEATVKDAFGDNVIIRKFVSSEQKGATMMLYYVNVKSLEANVPYLLMPENGKEFKEYTFKNVIINAAETIKSDLGNGYSFVGTPKYNTYVLTGDSVENVRWIGSKNNMNLYIGREGLTFKPTRCWFIYPSETSEAKISEFTGEADAISNVAVDDISNSNIRIYNVAGQYVGNDFSKLPAGLYISNGKKIIINK